MYIKGKFGENLRKRSYVRDIGDKHSNVIKGTFKCSNVPYKGLKYSSFQTYSLRCSNIKPFSCIVFSCF